MALPTSRSRPHPNVVTCSKIGTNGHRAGRKFQIGRRPFLWYEEQGTNEKANVAKMASHAIFQYNVLAIDDTHNTWTNMIVKDDHSQAFRFK
jgi:hypothetical protein